MKSCITCSLAAILVSLGTSFAADQTATSPPVESTKKGEQPKASPGWVVVDEDFWMPFKHEPLTAAQRARQHYILNEQQAAANELKKVISWAVLAEAHATHEGSNELQVLTGDLRTLIDDLEKGQAPKARVMDNALARIDHAFATHHYLKAKDDLAKQDIRRAVLHTAAAAAHLKNAASYANLDEDPDSVEYFDDIISLGQEPAEHVVIHHPQLSDQLSALKTQLDKLATALSEQPK